METIIIKKENNEHYIVTREGLPYRFYYDDEANNWLAGRIEEEGENEWEIDSEPVEADYGKIEEAVKSYFKLNGFGLFALGKPGEWLNNEPVLVFNQDQYIDAYEYALRALEYEVHMRDDLQPEIEFVYA